MRAWIGKFIIGIGVIHVAFGFVVFHGTLRILVAEGLFNTVNGQPDRELAFWFIIFGAVVILLGALTDWCERQAAGLPRRFGWSLLALTVLVVFIMPISGGWLLLAPSVGAIARARSSARD